MKFDVDTELDRTYALIAALFTESDEPERALSLCEELLVRGEDRSWASIWWAFGALHHRLTDADYSRALGLLARVDRSQPAKAAALMLTAEIESTRAIESGSSPDPARQEELLAEAVELAPTWPSLRIRHAYPLRELGEIDRSRSEASKAILLLRAANATEDPFDLAITGRRLDLDYLRAEVAALGEPI